VHHEDVRRAQPAYDVRTLPADQQEGLWKAVRLASKTMTRKSPSGLVLRRPDGTTAVAKRPTELGSVTVTGEPGELVLFCFGRQQVADVGLDGEAILVRTPVGCTIRPAALRVRVPRHRPGRGRAPLLDRDRLRALATIAFPSPGPTSQTGGPHEAA